jgi:hypothetical protein
MNRKWILTGALSFGMAGILVPLAFPTQTQAAGRERAEREFD